MRPIEDAKAKSTLPPINTPCRTVSPLIEKDCGGFNVKSQYIKARIAGKNGIFKGYVPGAGGDLWWVEVDGAVGVYTYLEITDIERK